MTDKVWNYIQKYHMLEENDYVVAGVSGGADSVCLLSMLLEIRKKLPMTIHVVHINHKIRAEAQRDASYVEALCQKNELPFTLVEEQVEELARQKKISTEEAGREVRYQAFYRVLRENCKGSRGKIAIAHNKNDSCETFLFHLFRGSGLKGLTGIRPVRGEIIRPIMCLEREEIEAYLAQKQIDYCIDQTNFEDNYTRNKIRHHILPVADKDISTGAVSHIQEACDKIQEAYQLIDDLCSSAYQRCVSSKQGTYYVNQQALQQEHRTIQSYVLYQVLVQAAGSSKDLEAVHTRQLQELMQKQCGRQLSLPYGLRAERNYQGISIGLVTEQMPYWEYVCGEDKELLEQGETIVIALPNGEKLSCRLIKVEGDIKNIPTNPYTKWVDYDKIEDNIVVRTRKKGDFLTINESSQHKTLKSFFIDEKIPKGERNGMFLVTEGSHVIWIIGNRISSYYKVDKYTKNIIEMSYRGGVEDG